LAGQLLSQVNIISRLINWMVRPSYVNKTVWQTLLIM